jgi:hypothetical protein
MTIDKHEIEGPVINVGIFGNETSSLLQFVIKDLKANEDKDFVVIDLPYNPPHVFSAMAAFLVAELDSGKPIIVRYESVGKQRHAKLVARQRKNLDELFKMAEDLI